MFDYIIVGGGLSGSLLGYLLKKNNLNVLIVEKQKIKNKDKLCGGILTSKAYKILKSIFPSDDIDNLIIKKYDECFVESNVRLDIKGINIYIINRKMLDNYILDRYLNLNGSLIDEANLKKIDYNQNRIVVNNKEYKYKYLIGADGALSFTRKIITGNFQRKNFAVEESFSVLNNNILIQFNDNFDGYNWIIPNNDSSCYGTGNVIQNTNIIGDYNNFLKKNNIISKNLRGAFLPTGDDIFLYKNNCFFIGDAAGLIDPITGEGIYYALFSAQKLADSFIKKRNYKFKMLSTCIFIFIKNIIKKKIYSTKFRNIIFRLMDKNKIVYKFGILMLKKFIL